MRSRCTFGVARKRQGVAGCSGQASMSGEGQLCGQQQDEALGQQGMPGSRPCVVHKIVAGRRSLQQTCSGSAPSPKLLALPASWTAHRGTAPHWTGRSWEQVDGPRGSLGFTALPSRCTAAAEKGWVRLWL
jgi:hypothetical protein